MSGQPEADVVWSDTERRQLRITREHARHDMDECAEVLRTEFGVAIANQPNLSKWETGATKRPRYISGLLAYCHAYGPGDRSTESVRHGPGTGQADDPSCIDASQDSAGDEVDEFDRLVGQAAGEPLLGAAQLELVRGMSRRLASGPPLSSEDRATYLDQLRILRVPDG